MRISTKLTSLALAVFLIVVTVGVLALDRIRDMAQLSIETEARNLATAMATMATYEIGYMVHATADPERAFELLAYNEIAVVLCDQRMPHMTGIEFLSRVRRMYPKTMRIMLSGYDDSAVTRQAINMGAVYKFLEKSSRSEELKEVVDDAFRHYLGGREPKLA